MLKKLSLLLTLLLLANSCALYSPSVDVCAVRWEGEVDMDLLQRVRADLYGAEEAGCTKLTVYLYSPGGSVIDGLEIIREMRAYKNTGRIIEVHGGALVASMAVAIFANASRGHRYIDKNAITVIHPMREGFMGETCVGSTPSPKNEDDAVNNALVTAMVLAMWEGTGQPMATILDWFTCGKYLVGNGRTLVDVGAADYTE